MAAIGFVLLVVSLVVMFLVKGETRKTSPAPNVLFASFLGVVLGCGFLLASVAVLLWRHLP